MIPRDTLMAFLSIGVQVQCGFNPGDKGCNYNFDGEECIFEVYCNSNFDIDINMVADHSCSNSIIFDGREFPPLSLYYKEKAPDYNDQEIDSKKVPYSDSYNLRFLETSVLYLDLSGNNYKFQPEIQNLQKLKTLDISLNVLTVAKLYNAFDLTSLIEIDFSYNEIITIDVDESQSVFKHLTKINFAHNNLLGITDAIFNDTPELAYIDLSHNYICNVSKLTFEGIQKLKFLQLSHNNLHDINSSLFRFSALIELYLNNNRIGSIKLEEFEQLYKLEILDLSNNKLENLGRGIFDNMHMLRKLDLSGNHLKSLDKDIFALINNLGNIDLSKNNLTNLPSNIFKQKSISTFSIEENNLQGSLRRGTFEGLKLVTSLNLSYQNISGIEDYTFSGLEKLTTILLNNNNIKMLSLKSFTTLRNLVYLDLSFNRIVDIDFDKEDLLSLQSLLLIGNYISQIKSNCFDNLSQLVYLDLSKNNVSHIHVNSFKSLAAINVFKISMNPLHGDIVGNTFSGLNSLPTLDISYTLLTSIKNNSFDGMVNLSDFNVSHSRVNEIQFNSFQNTGKIETMDLSFNQLEYFSVNATGLKILQNLYLNNNLIKFLPNNFIKGMTKLGQIDLSWNYIKSLHKVSFEDQENLHYLDLSFNSKMSFDIQILENATGLKTLILSGSAPNITFSNLSNEISLINIKLSHSNLTSISMLNLKMVKQVRSLDLSNNNLNTLGVGAFSNLYEVREIDVSCSKILFIQPGIFKDNFRLNFLNFSHNYISTLSYGVLRGLVHLKILDISYNSINSLETERFSEVGGLTDLIADHNKITQVTAEDFHGTHLTKLSIGDNPIPCDSLIKLKRFSNPELTITAIRLVDAIEENYEGITCNTNNLDDTPNVNVNAKSSKETVYGNEQVLLDIRNILFNWNAIKMKNFDEENSKNQKFTDLLESSKLDNREQLSNIYNSTFELRKGVTNTNQLLERLIKVTLAINSVNRSQPIITKENVSFEAFESYLSSVKNEIENKMVIEKEKILLEVDNKLSLLNRQEKFANVSTAVELPTQSSAFVETCIALILFILVCLVLYKLYKSKFYVTNRRSISTRQISDALDNSTL